MSLQTGGRAIGATSTRSRSDSWASRSASSMRTMPTCSPSGPTRRTSGTRIRSLMRGSALMGPPWMVGVVTAAAVACRRRFDDEGPANRRSRGPRSTGRTTVAQRATVATRAARRPRRTGPGSLSAARVGAGLLLHAHAETGAGRIQKDTRAHRNVPIPNFVNPVRSTAGGAARSARGTRAVPLVQLAQRPHRLHRLLAVGRLHRHQRDRLVVQEIHRRPRRAVPERDRAHDVPGQLVRVEDVADPQASGIRLDRRPADQQHAAGGQQADADQRDLVTSAEPGARGGRPQQDSSQDERTEHDRRHHRADPAQPHRPGPYHGRSGSRSGSRSGRLVGHPSSLAAPVRLLRSGGSAPAAPPWQLRSGSAALAAPLRQRRPGSPPGHTSAWRAVRYRSTVAAGRSVGVRRRAPASVIATATKVSSTPTTVAGPTRTALAGCSRSSTTPPASWPATMTSPARRTPRAGNASAIVPTTPMPTGPPRYTQGVDGQCRGQSAPATWANPTTTVSAAVPTRKFTVTTSVGSPVTACSRPTTACWPAIAVPPATDRSSSASTLSPGVAEPPAPSRTTPTASTASPAPASRAADSRRCPPAPSPARSTSNPPAVCPATMPTVHRATPITGPAAAPTAMRTAPPRPAR